MKVQVRGGVLRDEGGEKIARIVSATIEIEDSWLAETLAGSVERGGTIGGGTFDQETLEAALRDEGSGGKGTSADPAASPSPDIDAVWGTYVEVMKPRRSELDSGGRAVIRDAMKVATADECCRAIRKCARSAFHMGTADASRYQGKPRKYNSLSHILKGKRGVRSTREQIDMFLDMPDEGGVSGHGFPSFDPAVMSDKKRLVQRGWRFPEDEERVQNARDAEDWLAAHGVEVVRGDDGYPTFQAGG